MIEIKNVSKSYNKNAIAVDNINLNINDREIFGFLGPNGAGKTTTIKMVTGVINPDKGQIKVNSKDIMKETLQAKQQFGYVPDNPDIFLGLSGLEYLKFMCELFDVPKDMRTERIERLSQRFEMVNSLKDKIKSYSHGMRQKIVIMGTLVHEPPVWILDEPMTGLDPKASFILKEYMREYADSGKTVFFSTHILEVAEKICDRVGIINKGKILFSGTLDDMREHFKQNESLENMFLEMTENE